MNFRNLCDTLLKEADEGITWSELCSKAINGLKQLGEDLPKYIEELSANKVAAAVKTENRQAEGKIFDYIRVFLRETKKEGKTLSSFGYFFEAVCAQAILDKGFKLKTPYESDPNYDIIFDNGTINGMQCKASAFAKDGKKHNFHSSPNKITPDGKEMNSKGEGFENYVNDKYYYAVYVSGKIDVYRADISNYREWFRQVSILSKNYSNLSTKWIDFDEACKFKDGPQEKDIKSFNIELKRRNIPIRINSNLKKDKKNGKGQVRYTCSLVPGRDDRFVLDKTLNLDFNKALRNLYNFYLANNNDFQKFFNENNGRSFKESSRFLSTSIPLNLNILNPKNYRLLETNYHNDTRVGHLFSCDQVLDFLANGKDGFTADPAATEIGKEISRTAKTEEDKKRLLTRLVNVIKNSATSNGIKATWQALKRGK